MNTGCYAWFIAYRNSKVKSNMISRNSNWKHMPGACVAFFPIIVKMGGDRTIITVGLMNMIIMQPVERLQNKRPGYDQDQKKGSQYA